MKNHIYPLICFCFLHLFLNRCANPTAPTGGPKDTIPPLLLKSTPITQSLNFKGQTISLEFDEYINADKIKQNLIITPLSENPYKHTVKKNRLTIKFDEPFDDSTTYTLNFFKGVTDATEKLPAENLLLAFSTGPYIDSMHVYGSVVQLLTGLISKEKAVVALYRKTDSIDILKAKPNYFSSTDEEGQFNIQNIRLDDYRLIAFQDDNSNLIFDPSSEAHAFIHDSLNILEQTDTFKLQTVSYDVSPLNFISARPTAHYFEIRYSKAITKYQLFPKLPSKTVSDNTVIRVYNDSSIVGDSLKLIIHASDTVLNQRSDTTYVQFRESQRKRNEFKTSIIPKSGQLPTNPTIILKTSKPAKLSSTFAFQLLIDTLYQISIPVDTVINNYNNTTFELAIQLSKNGYHHHLDSIINIYRRDSANLDSIQLIHWKNITNLNRDKFLLSLQKSSILSVENDSNTVITNQYSFYKPENYGQLTVYIKTDQPSYLVQVIDKNGKPAKQKWNCNPCLFEGLKPEEYSVRIYIDINQNKTWDPGNILKNQLPEPVINFQEITTIRANWSVELNYQF